MAHSYEFYDARADEAAAEATRAKLDNVRDRALRAAQTWRGLADQARQVAVARQREDARRAAAKETA